MLFYRPLIGLRASAILIALGWTVYAAPMARGQFSTVINVPPQAAPSSIGSDTQLNLGAGGSLGNTFNAGATNGSSTNVEVNITGGTTSYLLTANAGATINISGGSVGSSLRANAGGVINVSGGSVESQPTANAGGTLNITGGDISVGLASRPGGTLNVHAGPIRTFFTADVGSNVNLFGGDFRLNGAPVAGLQNVGDAVDVLIGEDTVLSGTLEDGTPFALCFHDSDRINEATLKLHRALLPAIGQSLITIDDYYAIKGLRAGQTLVLNPGSYVPGWGFSAGHDSTVRFEGGRFEADLEAAGALVIMNSGEIHNDATLFDGSRLEMSGGSIGGAFAFESQIAITGGVIKGTLISGLHSNVDVENATIEHALIVWPEGTTNFRSGTVQGYAFLQLGTLNISGGIIQKFDFLAGTTNMSGGQVLANNPNYVMPTGVFNLSGGSVGDSFGAGNDAKINMSGGSFGNQFKLRDQATVLMSGGSIGDNASLSYTTSIIKTGGSIGDNLSLDEASRMGNLGGAIGDHLTIDGAAILSMTGGSIGDYAVINGGRLHISGGTVGNAFHANSGDVFLYGTQFLLNGQPISGLAPWQMRQINTRNVTLTGILVDGTPISFDLNSTSQAEQDYFSARLNVMLVNGLRGDYNGDGVVDTGDYIVWRRAVGTGVAFGTGADGDFNGIINDVDYWVLRTHFSRTTAGSGGLEATVPEASGLLMAAVAAVVAALSRPSTRLRGGKWRMGRG